MIFLGKQLFDASFDRFAQSYHNIRPRYPQQIYQDIQNYCGIGPNTSLLEIGAGSGIATRHLADLNCIITAIEPGEKLLNIAREEVAQKSNVTFINTVFEKYTSIKPFDVIFSATAFHWIKPENKFDHVDELLDLNGYLVLVWNSFCQSDTLAAKEVDGIYKKFFQESGNAGDPNLKTLKKIVDREHEVLSDGRFYIILIQRYIKHYDYHSKDYVALLNTFPNVINIDQKIKEDFFKQIASVVDRYGVITVPVLTSLYICKKAQGFTKFLNP